MAKKATKKVPPKKQRNGRTTGVLKKPLVATLKLKQIRLIQSEATLSIVEGHPPGVLEVKAELRLGSTSNNNLLADVMATAKTADPKTSEAVHSIVSIFVVIQCVFEGDSIPKADAISQQDKNEIANLAMQCGWPYVRYHVSTTTSSMGLPPATLPLILLAHPK